MLKQYTIYVIDGTAGFSPDGEGMVWYDTVQEVVEDSGGSDWPVVRMTDADFEELRWG